MLNQEIESFASRNRLIAALPPGDRERLLLRCRPVLLPNERVLVAPREEVRYAYFLPNGRGGGAADGDGRRHAR